MVEKIGYTRPVANARSVRKASSVGASSFADALAAAEGIGNIEGAESIGNISALNAMGGLLGAQEVDEREARRHKAIKRGRITLDTLEKLRDSLLIGALPTAMIHQLEQLVIRERDETTDPALKSILAEIEVRAAVELAKLEMSGIKNGTA